ncbi:hypothetical protein SAMN05421810_106330 [Amycolatopsis arida]|uniref:Uncharacterized protein n=1 Tax=Amycolatopsis arida TaxID=587909 RepID=A0A1I5XYP7_9PSEU|nr:hypothetical protein [Amycolatopsis arida]TDX97189.1 hypothetical protein CLV69_102292 [Amycolatopsis arida]SFQ37046.1 hypothetical protein SAMN05421810_106330 [Amycolatopsis arida]
MSRIHEPETLGELIADCAEIPTDLRPGPPPAPRSTVVEPWTVDDACLAQVADLDTYV